MSTESVFEIFFEPNGGSCNTSRERTEPVISTVIQLDCGGTVEQQPPNVARNVQPAIKVGMIQSPSEIKSQGGLAFECT